MMAGSTPAREQRRLGMALLAASVLALLLPSSAAAPNQQPVLWAGTITIGQPGHRSLGAVPFNVSVTGTTASTTWYFTGGACREQHETLNYKTSGSTATFSGCSAVPCKGSDDTNFYSLQVRSAILSPPRPSPIYCCLNLLSCRGR